jgi:hypothetical protein
MCFGEDEFGAKVNSRAQANLEKKPTMMKMDSYRKIEFAQWIMLLIAY